MSSSAPTLRQPPVSQTDGHPNAPLHDGMRPATTAATPHVSSFSSFSSSSSSSSSSPFRDGYGPPPFHPPPISTSAALTATPSSSSSSSSSSSHPVQHEQQTTPTTVSFHSADSPPARTIAGINSAYTAAPAPSSSPSSLSSAIAALSKAELIAQLQQARQQAQREAEDRRAREDQQRKAALEAELSALSAAVASKQDVVALHAAAAAELASKQASHSALKQEIARLQEAVEAERLRKERLQAQQQMEVTVLRQALEAERLDQERQARLLAARIAAVKMEIQERKAKYRARKQQDMQRAERAAAAAAAIEQQQQQDDRQDSELALLKKQREQMERELQTAQGGVLKSFTLDSISPMLWPGSPANPWHEPEACIRHVLRVDADFNIIAQPDHRRVRIKEMPFAKGGLRLAFFCEDITVPSHPFRLVAKESCYAGPKANSLSNFYNDVRSQLVARTFAERFNSLSPPKLVQFLLPMIYEFPFRSSPDRRYMAVELFMSGQYVKYSDNVQYVNSQFRTIPAFCHWSHASSGGQMMITDLQGVNYVLTDPQVHSQHPSAEFGLGGGDEQAMNEFFAQHRCNEICQALGLQPHREQQRGGAAGLQHDDDGMTRAGTQYASEVMGECGHVFILQVSERKDFLSSRGRMLCPDCRNNSNAVPFFPPER